MSKKIAYFLLYIFILLFGPFVLQAEAETINVFPPIKQQTEYPSSVKGCQQLLLDLYRFGGADQYEIRISAPLDLSQTAIGENVVYSDPTLETINFVSIFKKIKFIGTSAEATLTLPDTCFFGQETQLEKVTLQAKKIYGNGQKLLFKNIQHSQHTQLFGGSDRDLVGNPEIIFQQVTGGTWEIYGGNEAGTLRGNPITQILTLTGEITQLCGGSLTGTIRGNVATEIKELNGTLARYYGSGIGTEETPVEVTGETTNTLTSCSEEFLLGEFVGGAAYGKTGAITNLITGSGSFSAEGILIGGSQSGEINGGDRAISTTIDTRHFQKGERSFVGGNQYNGKIIGDIENQINARRVNKGSFIRIDGAGGMDLQKKSLSNTESFVPEINQTDPQKTNIRGTVVRSVICRRPKIIC